MIDVMFYMVCEVWCFEIICVEVGVELVWLDDNLLDVVWVDWFELLLG